MNLSAWFRTMGVVVVAAVALTACGGGGGGGNTGGGGGNSLTITSDGENLAYAPSTASASAGSISIAFRNTSASQQHNLALVRGDAAAADAVAAAGVAAGPPNYLPQGDPNVVCNTQMLNGGGEETISCNVEAGSYTYVCTFPGHSVQMKGTLTVQ